ncbi:serine/threonine protein phosphatase [Flavobacterium sp. LMO8]|uniref:metallophosphoesterase family protein n=1 Tax=Flavobacterium sp. LMO8 TaxID=2654244 RepID=UPI00129226C1|nr:metallophosphoesterase family protein [Flavobacterium sp. LMO8]MQP23909.1 serine/threonine protein phosphatase [Flavobacterium sp. LMO8]
MSRKLVIGDIHGGLKAVQQVLKRANVTDKDILIFLGDYVDGWSESPNVLDFLIELQKKQKCYFIRGNHDELLLDWLLGNTENIDEKLWFTHGGEATVLSYQKIEASTKEKHIQFLKSLQDYYLDDENRLFIHAGFTNMKGVEHEFFKPLFYWDRTLWETALALDNQLSKDAITYPNRLKIYNEIYIGHTPVTKIDESVPVNRACVWNVDTGAAFKGKLSIMDVDTKEFWQSDALPDLYPNEKGRN